VLLLLGGMAMAAVGGNCTIPAVILCREWVDPRVVVALVWCVVGFPAGVIAYRFSAPAPHRTDSPTEDDGSDSLIAWLIVRFLPFVALAFPVYYWIHTLATVRY
jgi:hypothetical protein